MARESPSIEVCGFLLGTPSVADGYYRATNLHPDPTRFFLIDPRDHLDCLREFGAQVVGTYHSHPYGTAHPSRYDCQLLRVSGLPMAIVAVHSGEIRVHGLEDGEPREWGVYLDKPENLCEKGSCSATSGNDADSEKTPTPRSLPHVGIPERHRST